MYKIASQGKCSFCDKIYDRTIISRHLTSHLKKIRPVSGKEAYHLKVEANPYFLHLLADGKTTLGEIDDLLRNIWLECCGHMSTFSEKRWNEGIPMDTEVGELFKKGTKIWYAYDFGSTTELDIKCMGSYNLKVLLGPQILTRNDPPDIKCDRCKKKKARQICTVHWGDEDMFFCETCVEIHKQVCEDAADYALLPVVNSPRMGVCAYGDDEESLFG